MFPLPQFSSAFKMESARFSEMLATSYQTARRNVLEDIFLQQIIFFKVVTSSSMTLGHYWGHAIAQWLRPYVTRPKVACSDTLP
jgi:hypothetical protein